MNEESPYSNRQIELLLDKQSLDIKQHMDSKTEPILVQTTATNGRVTKLEKAVEGSQRDIVKLQRTSWLLGIVAVAAWALVLSAVSGLVRNLHF